MGSSAPHVFCPETVNFFLFSLFSAGLPLETAIQISYNMQVYAQNLLRVTIRTMRGIDYMSASSKKKLRKEQNAAELTEKQLKEQKEAKKLKTYSTIFIAVMALVLCVAIVIGVSTLYTRSGISERNTVALTVGEHELSNAQLSYYYMDAINNSYSSWQSSYGDYTDAYLSMLYGLDTTVALSEQTYMGDETMTWADYFVEAAISNAESTYALYDAAVASGLTLTEEDEANIESSVQYMELYATLYGYDETEDYLKAVYGNGATEENFREYCEVSTLAYNYYSNYSDSLTYEDADIRAYEEDKYDEYSSFSYAYYYLASSTFQEGGTTDEDGNTTYTDEEKQAALEKAKATAESLLTATNVEELDAAIAALEINADNADAASSKSENTLYSSCTTALKEWLADDSRQEGDIAVVANESTSTGEDGEEVTSTFGYYVVLFQGRNDNTFSLVNVRHILTEFTGGTTDEDGNTVYSTEEMQTALDTITEVYNTWKSGDATEDSFAALVADNSDDTGSTENGGLYEDVYPGQMVTNFNDWCFDESRQPGDTDIIETEYGYHLMYFSGYSDLSYRDYMISTDMHDEDLESWYNGMVDSVVSEVADTSKLNLDVVLSNS